MDNYVFFNQGNLQTLATKILLKLFFQKLWMKYSFKKGDPYHLRYKLRFIILDIQCLQRNWFDLVFGTKKMGAGIVRKQRHRTFCIWHRTSHRFFFSIRDLFHEHWQLTWQQKGRDHLLFHSTTSTCSRTFRHLFATLHVRWLSYIFNRNACIYQTATRWDLPHYRITNWLIDDVMPIFVCLLVDLILGFVSAISHEKPVDSNSHRLSSLYYKRTD